MGLYKAAKGLISRDITANINMKSKFINTILENPQNITLLLYSVSSNTKMQNSKSSVNNISSIFVSINPTIHQDMFNRSISLKAL